MRTTATTDERIDLVLTGAEHTALADVVAAVLLTTSDAGFVMNLRTTPAIAHQFLQSICLLEARAAIAGTSWLDPRGWAAVVDDGTAPAPTLEIRFSEEGSVWRLTIDQFSFIGRCIGARPELMRWAA